MIKQKELPYARKGSSGNSRVDNFIPGTTIPKEFYTTIKLDLQKLLEDHTFTRIDIIKNEFKVCSDYARNIIAEYATRYRVFKHLNIDPGEGFKMDFNYAWCTTDDGTIQLLRMDMIPLSMRSIDAEIAWLDGKLQEVEEPDGTRVFREVEEKNVSRL